MPSIKITLNGREVECRRGQTILDVAKAQGVRIPTLCYHPQVSRTGACRICLVRVNNTMFKTACTEPVADGMKIVTADPEITAMRRGILEFLLAEGDHNCLYCEANGGCELQALCHEHGLDTPPPAGLPRNARTRDVSSSEGLRREENRCVLCGRCVKACGEIQMNRVWDFAGRGSHAHLTTGVTDVLGESDCVQCGQCVQLCPTGALSFQTVLGRGQAWELTRQSSICIYCGVGCKIDFFTNRDGLLVKAEGALDGPNEGHLCVKGRFGFDFVQSPKRLTQPLVRKDGELVPATWDEALDRVAGAFGRIKADHGPDAVMAFTSAKCTNEENYILQKFMRAVIGTNNVDHCARL
mgnify:FL=1